MKTQLIAAIAIISTVLAAGCASVAVTEEKLTQRTALALGLDSSEFTISNRVNEGIRTDYIVTTKTGERYTCYVSGVVSITGREVSDAMCNETQREKNGKAASSKPVTKNCNDLLRAAGRCK
jgi:hypothetical protein